MFPSMVGPQSSQFDYGIFTRSYICICSLYTIQVYMYMFLSMEEGVRRQSVLNYCTHIIENFEAQPYSEFGQKHIYLYSVKTAYIVPGT